MVHTKTSIPLSVNESGWYLNVPRHFAAQKYPPLFTPLQWIVLYFNKNCKPFIKKFLCTLQRKFPTTFLIAFWKRMKAKIYVRSKYNLKKSINRVPCSSNFIKLGFHIKQFWLSTIQCYKKFINRSPFQLVWFIFIYLS